MEMYKVMFEQKANDPNIQNEDWEHGDSIYF